MTRWFGVKYDGVQVDWPAPVRAAVVLPVFFLASLTAGAPAWLLLWWLLR